MSNLILDYVLRVLFIVLVSTWLTALALIIIERVGVVILKYMEVKKSLLLEMAREEIHKERKWDTTVA